MLTPLQKELLLRAQIEINERLDQSKHLQESSWVAERGGWVVEQDGTERITRIFPTKQEAIDYAKEVSRNQTAEIVIHGRNTRIQISHKDENGSCTR